jgi:hypothetical protein
MKSKGVKIGCKLAESSRENFCSKNDVFPMMIMLIKHEDRQTGIASTQYVNFI